MVAIVVSAKKQGRSEAALMGSNSIGCGGRI
jgi:hypothetical protein